MPPVERPATVIGSVTDRARGVRMAVFMDVHNGFVGVTEPQLREAHERDLAHQAGEGVQFERTWLDPTSGKVFCLSSGPSRDSVARVHALSGHPTCEIYEVTIEIS